MIKTNSNTNHHSAAITLQTISNLINQHHSHDIIHDLRYIAHQLRNKYITPDNAINSTQIILDAYGINQTVSY